jgi:polar amino acid transport system substrate-binding protein
MAAVVARRVIASAAFGVCLAAASGASAQLATVSGPADAPCVAEAKDLPLVKPGTLTLSINATIPPGQYIDKSGNIVGMSVDFGNEIARRLCLKPEYANVQFEVQIPGLQNKRWDIIDTGLFFTPARAKIMQLIPYNVNALALIAPSGNPKGIKDPKDLAGKVVGVEIAGFEEKTLRGINDEQVKAGLAPADIRVFNTYGDAFQALRSGQLDAVFAPDLIGAYYQKQGQFALAVTGLFPGSPAAFATVEPKLATAVVAALSAMVADGTYKKFTDYYGATPIDKWAQYPGKIQYFYTP